MDHSLKILHLEDIASDAELVDRALKKAGIAFEKCLVDTRQEYMEALDEFQPDVILSDHSLPTFNSLEALNLLKESGRNIPFILITSTVSEEFAVSVMKEGASDYVLKDRLQRLPSAVTNAVDKYRSDAQTQLYLNRVVASEALFSKAELLAGFGTWRLDLKTGKLEWSQGYYLLLGYVPGEVEPTNDNFFRNIHPEDIPEVQSNFKNAVEKRQAAEIDFRIIGRDGDIQYLHAQMEFELDNGGVPVYIIGFCQNITRSKLAQLEVEQKIEELKEAHERQTGILNALPANVVLLNENCKIVAVNESWRKLTNANNLGIPRYGIGYNYMTISEKATGVDPVTGKEITRGVMSVITGSARTFTMEYSCNIQQQRVWFQLIAAPLADTTQKGAVILHVDITSRKFDEQSRHRADANLRTIFENTDIAYVLCDAGHHVVSFNNRASELCLEQSGKRLKPGSNAFGYFPKNRVPRMQEAIKKAKKNEMISYETSYELADGSEKWYDVRWAGITGEDQENMGYLLAFKDITERKLSDMERVRVTNDLVQRNKDLEQFTYIVSHNLRAPVANIIGLSHLLNVLDLDDTEYEEIKLALHTAITMLDNTIIDLNHILEVSSKANELSEQVSFSALVADITLSLNHLIESERAVISYHFNEATEMAGIKSYLYSIFYNLILNGIKYRRPGIDPVITVSGYKTNTGTTIRFQDNGKGIEEKNLKNLFGLYKRFDTDIEGKGMGLFMVKMQVESMGGSINVESEPAKGSVFIIEFPDLTSKY
ncbi:MAG: PAS domain S-box protein [Bacteroidetes bacterium]|jgi:PAS domain S-box-containing protein|nr:PAS domain S-box protein [Bacteroidota bacterium]